MKALCKQKVPTFEKWKLGFISSLKLQLYQIKLCEVFGPFLKRSLPEHTNHNIRIFLRRLYAKNLRNKIYGSLCIWVLPILDDGERNPEKNMIKIRHSFRLYILDTYTRTMELRTTRGPRLVQSQLVQYSL